jgi:hypothetical protein
MQLHKTRLALSFTFALLLLTLPLAVTAAEAPVTATTECEVPVNLEQLLTEAPVTPMAALPADALDMGPKPRGLCANDGCATSCRDDADCGPGGTCIYTACF